MKYAIHPGYEILAELAEAMILEKAGQGKAYSQGVDHLVAFDKPDDMRITQFVIPGLQCAPGVPVYLYETVDMAGKTPLLIAIHGGGFTGGRADFDANRIAYYVRNVPCRVLSVDYRLAPEGVFPKSLEDCYAALIWAHDHAEEINIDRRQIAVAGYSAGGTLAAGLCLYARDQQGPKICAQILTFPVLAGRPDSGSAMQFYDDAPMLQGSALSGIVRDYLGAMDGQVPSYYALPAYCSDLSGLPATAIAVGEYDPLRDECMAYAAKLMQFAVPVEFYCLPRVPHAFDLVCHPMTEWLWQGLVRALRREFGLLT